MIDQCIFDWLLFVLFSNYFSFFAYNNFNFFHIFFLLLFLFSHCFFFVQSTKFAIISGIFTRIFWNFASEYYSEISNFGCLNLNFNQNAKFCMYGLNQSIFYHIITFIFKFNIQFYKPFLMRPQICANTTLLTKDQNFDYLITLLQMSLHYKRVTTVIV